MAALCALGVISFAYFVCGGPVFETNDDVAMWMVASGNGSVDRPDEHLLFISFLLGKVLNALYGVTQQVPWYGLMLAGSQFLALTVIARVLLNKNQKKTPFALSVIVLFFFTLRPIVLMQFTSTAALLAVSAALILLVGLELKKSLSPRILIPVIALTTLASLLRADSTKLVFIMTGFVILARCWTRKNRQRTTRALISVVIPIAMAFSFDALNNAYYAKDQWSEFHHVNSYRFPLMTRSFDTSNEQVTAAVKSAGWSPVDLHMFEFWFIQDPQTYSLDKLKKIIAGVPRISDNFFAAVVREWSVILSDVTVLPMFGFIAYAVLQASRSRLKVYPALSLLLSFVVVSTGLALIVYLPARVYSGLLCLLGVSLAFYARKSKPLSGNSILLLLLGALVFCLPAVTALTARCKDVSVKSQRLHAAIETFQPDSKKLFVSWAGEFPFELIRPFQNLKSVLNGMRFVQIDCFGRCPHVLNRLEQHGMVGSKFIKGLTSPDVFVFCMEPINNLVRFYSREHDHQDLRSKTVYFDPLIPMRLVQFTEQPFEELRSREYQLVAGDYFALPGTEQWMHKNIKFIKKLGEVASYEIPKSAQASLEYERAQTFDFSKYPQLLIDVKVDPWQVCMGWMFLKIGDENDKDNCAVLSRPLINDGKMHTYSYRLDRLKLENIRKITLRPSLGSLTRSADVSLGKVLFTGKETAFRNQDDDEDAGSEGGTGR